MVRGGRPRSRRRPDGDHVRAARGHRPRCAAGLCRQPPRHAADRRQVRRGARRARRAGSGPLAERSRHQDQASDRRHQLDQRGGNALCAGDAGVGRVRRHPQAGLGLRPQGPRRQALRRRARAHRLEGRRAGRRAQAARVLRAAYRAGADPRGRGHRHRRRHPWPGPEMAGGAADRQGEPYRLDADAEAAQCRARHGARHRTRPRGGDGLPARRRRRGRPYGGLSELAQHHRRPHRLHHRHPLAGQEDARRDGRAHPRRHRADLRGARHQVRDRAGRPFRSGDLRQELRQGGPRRRRNGSAIRIATSSRAPATTPAGSTASRRPRWCCVPASTGCRTTRPRTFRRNGPRPGPTCCSTRWWRRRGLWSERAIG